MATLREKLHHLKEKALTAASISEGVSTRRAGVAGGFVKILTGLGLSYYASNFLPINESTTTQHGIIGWFGTFFGMVLILFGVTDIDESK